MLSTVASIQRLDAYIPFRLGRIIGLLLQKPILSLFEVNGYQRIAKTKQQLKKRTMTKGPQKERPHMLRH